MDANAFRHFYNYHFAENRNTWDMYIADLSEEQFTQNVDGHWSVKEHIVHIISVDDTWFSGLLGQEIPERLDPANFADRDSILDAWDRVEEKILAYLADLQDDGLNCKPLDGEDEDLRVWQVLLHVVNHGTDHRAQLRRVLNDVGVKTVSQDYIFYVYDNP